MAFEHKKHKWKDRRNRFKTDESKMNSEFFVRIEEPKKLRKKLLETSREVVLLIQDHESIKRIKQEKIELLNEAAKTISEINMLIQTAALSKRAAAD